MFLSDNDFRRSVADALKVDEASLAKYWDNVGKQCHESAYKDIRGALLTRGFTAGQIDSWDRGAEFERDIGLYWCCVRGVGFKSLDAESVSRLDRRAELMTVMVEVAGGATQEPAATPGRISAGMLSNVDANGKHDRWTKHTPL